MGSCAAGAGERGTSAERCRVTVNRSVNIVPDQAPFAIDVTAAPGASQEQLLQVFRDAGAGSVSIPYASPIAPSYSVSAAVPAEAMAKFAAALDQLRAK